MQRAIIAVLVYGVLLGAPLTARAASFHAPQCLADHPAAVGDAAALAAVRAQIDASCPCDSFTPTTGRSKHLAYVACATRTVLQAVLQEGELRGQCLSEALYPAVHSTCGYPLAPPRAPCVHTSARGVVGCTITTAEQCDGAREVFCAAHTNCLDAADTNQDSTVGRGDSGACTPVQDCEDQLAQGQPRIDEAAIACFDGCTEAITYQECVIGCAAGGNLIDFIHEVEYTACQANPMASCEALRDINLASCASPPWSPPTKCVTQCFDDPICEQKCTQVYDCHREVEAAYAYCVQTQP
jgi:hypothetical protein